MSGWGGLGYTFTHILTTTLISFTLSHSRTLTSEESTAIPDVGVDMLMKDGKLDHLKNGPIYWVDSADVNPCMGKTVVCYSKNTVAVVVECMYNPLLSSSLSPPSLLSFFLSTSLYSFSPLPFLSPPPFSLPPPPLPFISLSPSFPLASSLQALPQ